jgi:hypothetical protein
MGAVLSHDVLCGVSWNVDRIAEHSKEMFVQLMMKQYAFVLLQEREAAFCQALWAAMYASHSLRLGFQL